MAVWYKKFVQEGEFFFTMRFYFDPSISRGRIVRVMSVPPDIPEPVSFL